VDNGVAGELLQAACRPSQAKRLLSISAVGNLSAWTAGQNKPARALL
jgi:hypothetical protein